MNNWKSIAGITGVIMAVAGPAGAEDHAAHKIAPGIEQDAAASAAGTVVLKDQGGKIVGTLKLTAGESGIAMSGNFTSLPPGPHGFHIHEKGVCTGDFASAGGHFNPGKSKHGILSDSGHHAGDLPNVDVPASGAVNVNLFLTGVSLNSAGPDGLFDQDGSSLVVHAGPDDYKTDPSGNSGGRIACGVVEPVKP